MAAYRWVYDSRHLQADCQEPGSALEPYAWWSTMSYVYLLIGTRTLLHLHLDCFWYHYYYYSARDRGAEYCEELVCLSACVYVCLSAIILSYFKKQHIRSSPNFLCMLPIAVAQSFSGGTLIRFVLPVLWMTSYFLISQGCLTSPPSWSTVHMQPWAWLWTVCCRPMDAWDYFSGT